MEKMTYVSVLNDILNGAPLTAERRDKVSALIRQIEKQGSQETKTQKDNKEMQTRIENCMVEGLKYSCSELIDLLPFLRKPDGTKLSTQKVAPMLHALERDGKIHSITIKGKNYFYKGNLADED